MSSRGGASARHVASACPLDCPDACSLDVTVDGDRVVAIGGSHVNPVTQGYICAKVREYPRHMYGEARLLHPGRSNGPQGRGQVRAGLVGRGPGPGGREAEGGARMAEAGRPSCPSRTAARTGTCRRTRPTRGSSVASAPRAWRARSARRPPRRPTPGLYGKMTGIAYPDYALAKPDRALGRQPVRVRDPPVAVRPGGAEAGRPSRGRRPAPHPPRRARGPASSRSSRARTCRSRSRSSGGSSPTAGRTAKFLEAHATGRRGARAPGRPVDARTRGGGGAGSGEGHRAARGVVRRVFAGGAALRLGARSAAATAALRRRPSWRCRRSPASSACAAADTRCPTPRPGGTLNGSAGAARGGAGDARRQHEPPRRHPDRGREGLGRAALRLQRESADDDPGPGEGPRRA